MPNDPVSDEECEVIFVFNVYLFVCLFFFLRFLHFAFASKAFIDGAFSQENDEKKNKSGININNKYRLQQCDGQTFEMNLFEFFFSFMLVDGNRDGCTKAKENFTLATFCEPHNAR